MDHSPQSETEPEELLSLNGLSRRLDISYPRALEMVVRGVIRPDFVTSRKYLFRPTRLSEIEAIVSKPPTP